MDSLNASLSPLRREFTSTLTSEENTTTDEVSTHCLHITDDSYRESPQNDLQPSVVPPKFLLRRPRPISTISSNSSLPLDPLSDETQVTVLPIDQSALSLSDPTILPYPGTVQPTVEKSTAALTLEEREQAYEEARRRIFGTSKMSEYPVLSASSSKDMQFSSYLTFQPRSTRPRPYRVPNPQHFNSHNTYSSLSGVHSLQPQHMNSLCFSSTCVYSPTDMSTYPSSTTDTTTLQATHVGSTHFSCCNRIPIDGAGTSANGALPVRYYGKYLERYATQPDLMGGVSNLYGTHRNHLGRMPTASILSDGSPCGIYSTAQGRIGLEPMDSVCSSVVFNDKLRYVDKCRSTPVIPFSITKRPPRKEFYLKQNIKVDSSSLSKDAQPSYDVEFPPL